MCPLPLSLPLYFTSTSLVGGWGSFFSLLINSQFNSMAVDVTSLVLMMNGYKEENHHHHQQQKMMMSAERDGGEGLITRDLLGNNNSRLGSKELDLDLQVPLGWEKRLDLKSGKVYIQRCNSPPMSSSTTTASSEHDQNHRQLQDLNFPPSLPSSKNINMMIEDDTTLELKLFPSSSSSSSTTTCTSYHNYRNQSVCTLDKVKSALERAEKEKEKEKKKPATLQFDLSSSSSSNREDEAAAASSSPMFAAGCPSCLLYVLISKTNPLCPRCNSIVPVPTPVVKKPRIDLNSALM